MGKTAMPIIWFFTKISSVVSERLNTPVLNIVVHLEFHSNNVKKLKKFEWNFKCTNKSIDGQFSLSIIILVKFNRNYIINIAVLPITEGGFLKWENI